LLSRSCIVLLAWSKLARSADAKSRQKGWMLDCLSCMVPTVAGSGFFAFYSS
jgi:hypothetical protein